MRTTLTHLFTRSAPASATFCEARAEACTTACRALAQADRERTAVLAHGLAR